MILQELMDSCTGGVVILRGHKKQVPLIDYNIGEISFIPVQVVDWKQLASVLRVYPVIARNLANNQPRKQFAKISVAKIC
ncbi:MAG: hypothetical protein R3B84_21660 [Zavarzinella sp.]